MLVKNRFLLITILLTIDILKAQQIIHFVDSCFSINYSKNRDILKYKNIYDFYTLKSDNIILRNANIWTIYKDSVSSVETDGEHYQKISKDVFKIDYYNDELKLFIINAVSRARDKIDDATNGFVALRTLAPLKKDSLYELNFTYLFSEIESQIKLQVYTNNKPMLKKGKLVGEITVDTSKWLTSTIQFKSHKNQQWIIFSIGYGLTNFDWLSHVLIASPCTHLYEKIVEPKTSSEAASFDTVNPVILTQLHFDINKSELLGSSFSELDKLIVYLKQNSLYKIEISGYTDNTGNELDNIKLSEARARAVADYLKTKGINEKRISHKGYGSANPVYSNDSEEGRNGNRRVEFKIVK